MIKKILALILAMTLVVGLSACQRDLISQDSTASEGKMLSVVTTIFPPYDFSREIAGDTVQLKMLLPPGAESHSFEPTPQDIITIQNCDIFIYTGGESEAWVDSILGSMDTSKMQILSMLDMVEVLEEETVEGMQSGDAEDGHKYEYDEHVWTSPVNAQLIVQGIASAMKQASPENSELYSENAGFYIEQLKQLDADFHSVTDDAPRRTMIFGDRFPFLYFAREYDLDYYAAFPGCSTDTEPDAATVAFLIDKISREKIPVILHIEFSNERMADAISDSTGAKKLLLHSCHNVSTADIENGVSYIMLMRQNIKSLKEALY